MSQIPTRLTAKEFARHVEPHLSKARRGLVCKIPLFKVFNYILYLLHTGCQWEQLPIDPDPNDPTKPESAFENSEISTKNADSSRGKPNKFVNIQMPSEISPDAIYYHFRKWCRDGSLQRVWEHSVRQVRRALDVSVLNLDGTHTIAKKGGQSVAYQGRKKAKTSNLLPLTDKHGYVLASTGIVAGNHHDTFNLVPHLRQMFQTLKRLDVDIHGSLLNADTAFDSREARQVCFAYGVIPNMAENRRNRKHSKRGRQRLFDAKVYAQRFGSERTFAWVDKFKRLLIRFERKDAYFFGVHCIAFAMINLRNLIN